MSRVPRPNPARFQGRLMTNAEMAKLLGWPEGTLRGRARSGKVPDGAVIRTLGGHRRFDAGKMLAAEQEGMWR